MRTRLTHSVSAIISRRDSHRLNAIDREAWLQRAIRLGKNFAEAGYYRHGKHCVNGIIPMPEDSFRGGLRGLCDGVTS
jgi:hypothetical protein